MTIQFRPFNNTSFDGSVRAELTYDGEQPLVSPVGMPAFEEVDTDDPMQVSNAISGVDDFVPTTEPDATGKRCKSFVAINRIAKNIHAIWRSIAPENVDPKNEDFVRQQVEEMRELVRSSKEFVDRALTFQEKVTEKWNEDVGEVTKTMMLGLCGLAEESGKQCGAITLDLEYMAGILKEKEDGGWELADNWEERFILLVGDCKTVENVVKFIRDITNRDVAYDESSKMADDFMNALSRVMQLPGDWHAGLAMLQSIYTLFWDGLLKPFKDVLQFKRITRDVRGCYFQASRLGGYVADEIMRALVYEYASTYASKEDSMDNNTYICKFAMDFNVFLHGLKDSDDEWRRVCALFLIMYTDFRRFVDSYREGDAVSILHGYMRFAPIWQELGQSKYVERHWHQLEQLFRDFPFSRYMEAMINRCVRRYPKEDGKRMVAHDEHMENMNASFAAFPKVKTLSSFVQQGAIVGLVDRCKRAIELSYCIRGDISSRKREVFTSAIEPSTTQEKKRVWECLMLLRTCSEQEERRMTITLVSNIIPCLTVSLKKNKKGKKKQDSDETHSYDRLLSTVEQLLPSRQASVDEAGATEGEVADEEAVTASDEDAVMAHRADIDLGFGSDEVREDGRRKIHDLMTTDVWAKGEETFKKKDLKKSRKAASERAQRHRVVQREKMRAYIERKENARYGMLKEDKVGGMAHLHTKLQELRMASGKTNVNVPQSQLNHN